MSKPDDAKKPAKRNPETLSLTANSPDEVEPLYASQFVRPALSAALTVRRWNSPAPDELTIDALVAELDAQAKAINTGDLSRGEAMLTAQAHTLDAIFGTCARRAQASELLNHFEAYTRVALRAQSQCRATWETLWAMKNPAPATFVRQANIANGPQQVNNGPMPEASRAGENRNPPNKLSEADNGLLRQDTRASALAGRADPQMATVGEVNRAKDGGG